MVKVIVQTDKHKRFSLVLPLFLLSPFLDIALSKKLWKFIHHKGKNNTVDAIYTNITEIKFLLKTLSKELKAVSLPEPLVDIHLKDGTYVKVAIT
ncbi:hypothetical protein ACTNDN_21525 [Niallia sp. HCP3S3_B10]|uniref:hypothetical protein n=1 Tax=unclassified Niallia TaxID=2837522 RepID=UPI002041EDC7|nr:hypothetical protein [Niallia sp. MER TA 168]MCM3362780.1 hypothetical protein [Niallia sp. MER TA 168]